MTENQQKLAAHSLIGFAHKLLADMDGVLPCDFEASTTAIVWQALEFQLGGDSGVSNLINQRIE
jgi:hypothetical protein